MNQISRAHPPGGGVIPGALEPPKFWQKWGVFLTLEDRIKQMEYAVGLGCGPCQMQPFIGEAGGKGALFTITESYPLPLCQS